MKDAYDRELDKYAALTMVQQIVLTSPEFHTSGVIVERNGEQRPLNSFCYLHKNLIWSLFF